MFKTYNASAGSGKTTNLVAEYLTICLQAPDNYRHVLAVTFTNNATAEMKERILHTLNDFAFTDPAVWDYWEEQPKSVQKKLGKSQFIHKTTRQLSDLDSDLIRERSEALLENILAHYPDFAISTIDSFFQRILRSFAFDLGLSTDFNVEVTLDDYFQQTVDLLYQRISNKSKEGKDLARRVINLMEQKMEEDGKWRIDYDLLTLLKDTYFDEQAPLYIDLLKNTDFSKAAETLNVVWNTNKEKMGTLIAEGKDILHSSGIPEEDFPCYGILDWFNQATPYALKSFVTTEKAIAGESFTKKGKRDLSDSERKAIIAKKEEIEQLFRKVLLPCQMVRKNLRRFQLLFDLQQIMEELKVQDNKFFLSETGQLIQREVKDNPVPYIYNKVGTRFRNYFIDEFQDTSDTQWENMLPLMDEAVSTDGKVILFGDVKQAIYRFRNGNPQLFADLARSGTDRRKHFEERTRCEEELLDANHRTLRKIIRFNNLFFKQMPEMPAFPERLSNYPKKFYDTFYETVKQEEDKQEDGFVAIRFCPNEEETVKDDYLVSATLEALRDATEKRHYRLHNIAVLTRTTAAGTLIGKALSENGIPVISADSLVLGSNENVNLVLTLMKYIATPSDALNRFYLTHLLLKREGKSGELAQFIGTIAGEQGKLLPLTDDMTEDERNEIIAQNKETEKRHLQENILKFNILLKKQFNISVQQKQWANLPLLTLVHNLMTELNLRESDPYLIGLIDLVNDYTGTKGNTLDTFLKWWDEKGAKKAVTSPENVDAVRIMTIHKAKGKEFPVVIMPVLNKHISKLTKPKMWQRLDEKELGIPVIQLRKGEDFDKSFGIDAFAEECALTALDETNILYVGQTRPEEALYIIADKKRDEKKSDEKKRGDKEKENGSDSIFNYSLLLEDFIKNNEAFFTEKEGWTWFGDDTHARPEMPPAKEADNTSTPRLPFSGFTLESLIPAEIETEQQEIGIAVHHYFETAEHFPMTEEEAEQWTFDESQPYQEEIRAALKSLTKNTALLPYFADGLSVLKEVNLLTADGERRRPDRVVQKDGETVVIDFKTGEPTKDAKQKYQTQVDEYVRILREMGFPNVRGELLYL